MTSQEVYPICLKLDESNPNSKMELGDDSNLTLDFYYIENFTTLAIQFNQYIEIVDNKIYDQNDQIFAQTTSPLQLIHLKVDQIKPSFLKFQVKIIDQQSKITFSRTQSQQIESSQNDRNNTCFFFHPNYNCSCILFIEEGVYTYSEITKKLKSKLIRKVEQESKSPEPRRYLIDLDKQKILKSRIKFFECTTTNIRRIFKDKEFKQQEHFTLYSNDLDFFIRCSIRETSGWIKPYLFFCESNNTISNIYDRFNSLLNQSNDLNIHLVIRLYYNSEKYIDLNKFDQYNTILSVVSSILPTCVKWNQKKIIEQQYTDESLYLKVIMVSNK